MVISGKYETKQGRESRNITNLGGLSMHGFALQILRRFGLPDLGQGRRIDGRRAARVRH